MAVKRRWLVVFVAVASSLVQAGTAQAPDHLHVKVDIVIAPSQPGTPGDMMGIYAFELLPCAPAKGAGLGGTSILEIAKQSVLLFIPSAQANHREHFDGPGAREVMQRVPLDQARRVPLGNIPVATGLNYCRVRLTLARLPSTQIPVRLPALETSVFMARPGGLAPLAMAYAHPFDMNLAKPWKPSSRSATLAITLDPALAKPVLADATLDIGVLNRKALTVIAEGARLELRLATLP
jgi:hypothetical protein